MMSGILTPTARSVKPTETIEQPSTSSAQSAIESDPFFYPKPDEGFEELDGLRVALARPTYSNMEIKPENSLLSSLMTACNHGVKWDANLSPDRMGWGQARNFAAAAFVDNCKDADGLLWVDSDIIPPIWGVWKLLSWAKRGYHFVSGVYFNRGNPWAPVIYEYRSGVDGYANVQSFPPNTLWKIEGCGFGFCYTSRKLLEDIKDHPTFSKTEGWFPDTRWQKGGRGEDFNFCVKAIQAGHEIYADTSILLGHSGEPHIFTILDHMKAHDGVK